MPEDDFNEYMKAMDGMLQFAVSVAQIYKGLRKEGISAEVGAYIVGIYMAHIVKPVAEEGKEYGKEE